MNYIHSSFGVIKEIHVLMKCFCDIPLNYLMENHIEAYGSYGIGIKKEWGIKNNLTPVHYIPTRSSSVWYQNNLASLYSSALSETSNANMRDLIINYIIYTKPYEKDGTVFYNEREWRYIPSLDNINKISNEDIRVKWQYILPNQATSNLNTQSLITESNNLKNNEYIRLPFNLNDIECLIVKKNDEKDKARNLLNGNDNIDIFLADEILKSKESMET